MTALHPAQAALQEVIQGTTWRANWQKENQSFTQVEVAGGRLDRGVIKLMLPPAPDEVPIPRPASTCG